MYYLLKWIKFSVLKKWEKMLEKSGNFCQSGKVGTMEMPKHKRYVQNEYIYDCGVSFSSGK